MINYSGGKVKEGDDDFKDPANALYLPWDHHFFDVDPKKSASKHSGNRDSLISMDPKLRTKGDD